MIASKIKIIPIHCNTTTFSFNIKKAINTDTGNSKEETILPRPIPVRGNPAFIKSGGMMVPKSAKKRPYSKKIL